jgi:hypothetical protein
MFHARFQTSGAALRLALAACCATVACGDGDGHKRDVAAMIGTWTISTGSLIAVCPSLGFPLRTTEIQGQQLTFSPGTDADLVIERAGCKAKFDVAGHVATAQAGQTCSLSIENPLGGTAGGTNPLPVPVGSSIGIILGIDKAAFTATGTMGTYEQSGSITPPLPLPALSGCTYGINVAASKKP